MRLDGPIVIGLAGKAGTGKTSVANRIAPIAQTFGFDEKQDVITFPLKDYKILWDHMSFAEPLHEIVTAKQKITGADAQDRQAYAILDVLLRVFGRNPLWGAPPFKDLIKIVNTAAGWHLDPDLKPRAFMQWLGTDVCRKHDPDCWVRTLKTSLRAKYQQFLTEQDDDEIVNYTSPDNFGVVISDLRFPNEVEAIRTYQHGYVIRFDASDDVREARLISRDGVAQSEHSGHASETALDSLSDNTFSAIINTDGMDVTSQAYATQVIIKQLLEGTYGQD